MERLFERSRTRRRRDLRGTWDFVAAESSADQDFVDAFPEDAETLAVPSVWNTKPNHFRHHGVGWFRRHFSVPESTVAKLTFHGVAHEAAVYLDGELIAEHDCGFTPFSAVIHLDAGKHELVVRADSELHQESFHHGDYYKYGGITREVILEELQPVFVDDLTIEYDLDGTEATVRVTTTVRNEREDSVQRPLSARVGTEASTKPLSVSPGKETETLSLELSELERWAPSTPRLYPVVASVCEDELRDRIGFREITIDGTTIRLNGEPIELRGVNRHEDHPDWGHTQPQRIQEADLEIMERAGFNAVRTSHYPNHPRFLDYWVVLKRLAQDV